MKPRYMIVVLLASLLAFPLIAVPAAENETAGPSPADAATLQQRVRELDVYAKSLEKRVAELSKRNEELERRLAQAGRPQFRIVVPPGTLPAPQGSPYLVPPSPQ